MLKYIPEMAQEHPRSTQEAPLQQPAIYELHYPLVGEGHYLETNN